MELRAASGADGCCENNRGMELRAASGADGCCENFNRSLLVFIVSQRITSMEQKVMS